MDKQNIKDIYAHIQAIAAKFLKKAAETLRQAVAKQDSSASWWQIALGAVICIVFLYYPIGGWMVHNIDTSSSYQPKSDERNLSSIDVLSHLINREVHYKIWTPNLPFLFPSYFLDNMPNFQLGVMSAVSKTAQGLNKTIFTSVLASDANNLSEAAELLQYPGNIWLFSPQNKLLPVPSSNTQYKKGRKRLNNFNQQMASGKIILPRDARNLSIILRVIQKDLSRLVTKNENHIRENHDSFVDMKADDIFYFDLGKLYAYNQILKALGYDFKNVLINYDVYQQWTEALKVLQDASDLNPTIIRNGNMNSSFAPNHLVKMAYFASRVVNLLNSITATLTQPVDIQK